MGNDPFRGRSPDQGLLKSKETGHGQAYSCRFIDLYLAEPFAFGDGGKTV